MNTQYIKEYNNLNIFGAGNTALKVKNVLQNVGKSISTFIISSGDDRKIDNISVVSLNQLSDVNKEIPIIIAIFNREPNSFLMDIISKLKSYGFTKIITYPEFHSMFPTELGDIFWLTDKKYYDANIEEYKDVLKILSDQTSIECYSIIIDYLKTFNTEILPKPSFENQYFPKDLIVWNGKGAFFDIGSFDGENIIDAYNSVGILEEVIAFEPDLINFQKIVSNDRVKNICSKFFLYPCGVWSETTLLRFKSGDGESSSQSIDGDQIVPVVKIDDVAHTLVGLIKMDIEGAEIEALLGAKNTICKFRPSLAISLYHKRDHFFAIPKLIQSWNLNYKFYIRFHGNNLFETVLYCIQ